MRSFRSVALVLALGACSLAAAAQQKPGDSMHDEARQGARREPGFGRGESRRSASGTTRRTASPRRGCRSSRRGSLDPKDGVSALYAGLAAERLKDFAAAKDGVQLVSRRRPDEARSRRHSRAPRLDHEGGGEGLRQGRRRARGADRAGARVADHGRGAPVHDRRRRREAAAAAGRPRRPRHFRPGEAEEADGRRARQDAGDRGRNRAREERTGRRGDRRARRAAHPGRTDREGLPHFHRVERHHDDVHRAEHAGRRDRRSRHGREQRRSTSCSAWRSSSCSRRSRTSASRSRRPNARTSIAGRRNRSGRSSPTAAA